MDLIYCAGKNQRFDTIALDYGFKYGIQLPASTIYYDLFFADQNWKEPNRKKYMEALEEYRPIRATVLDLENYRDLGLVLDWAEEASQFIQDIIIIPKVCSIIKKLPDTINGSRVILGYSVPTSYGATNVPIWEFKGWDIHLLGGSPDKQIQLFMYLDNIANVISLDLNSINKACQFGTWWDNGWHNDYSDTDKDFIYRVFEKSCKGIMKAWDNVINN